MTHWRSGHFSSPKRFALDEDMKAVAWTPVVVKGPFPSNTKSAIVLVLTSRSILNETDWFTKNGPRKVEI
jgi:hypothetical protein